MGQKIVVKDEETLVTAVGKTSLKIIPTGAQGVPGPQGPPGPTGPTGPQPDLSDAPPEALGVASPGVDAEASRSDHVHPLPSPGDVGAATAAQGSLADSAVQPGDLATVATSGDYDDLSNKPTIPPAAPVDSVNGETGVVVLDAGDVGAVPTARTITAGTGLTGGGDLSADRTLTVTYGTTAGTAAAGDDARLSDARTPTAHAASHQDGGSDELALDGSQITSGTVAAARLGSGTPTAGTVLTSDGAGGAAWDVGSVAAVVTSTAFPSVTPIGPNHAGTFASNAHGLGAAGREAYVPFFCPAGVYDAIGVNVTTASAATWRLGIADSGTDGWMSTILLDAGTVDMSVGTGWQAISGLTFTVTRPRWMWMQVKCVAYTANPSVTCLDGITSAAFSPRLPGWPVYGDLPARALVGCYTLLSRGTGGLTPAATMTNGNAGTGVGFSQTSPLVVIRRAA